MGRMHQTTLRFGSDLWEALEVECERLGVSAAQYLREAAVARLAYSAGRRGDPAYEEALVAAGVPLTPGRAPGRDNGAFGPAECARAITIENQDESSAVRSQSELVQKHAREVRDRSRALRDLIHARRGSADDNDVA